MGKSSYTYIFLQYIIQWWDIDKKYHYKDKEKAVSWREAFIQFEEVVKVLFYHSAPPGQM